MNIIVYDKTFAGLLTAVFEIYEYKYNNPVIKKEGIACNSLFGVLHVVHTNVAKAARVFKKLKEKMSIEMLSKIYSAFLSEINDVENIIFRVIQYALASLKNIEGDLSNTDVLQLQQISRKVSHEAHRMKGFIRFQLSSDNLYFALIETQYNVLPMIVKHFKARFASQQWLIYDTKRNYGIYYDLKMVTEITLVKDTYSTHHALPSLALNEKETLYQKLWQQYFNSTFIPGRKNTRLHVQLLPRRYWKNLTEKMPVLINLND